MFLICAISGVAIKSYTLGVFGAIGYPDDSVRVERGVSSYISRPRTRFCNTYIVDLHVEKNWISEGDSTKVTAEIYNQDEWLTKFHDVLDEYFKDTEYDPAKRTIDHLHSYLRYTIADFDDLGISKLTPRLRPEVPTSKPWNGLPEYNICPDIEFNECVSLIKKIAESKESSCRVNEYLGGNFSFTPQFEENLSIPEKQKIVVKWQAEPRMMGSVDLQVGSHSQPILVTKYPGIPNWLAAWGSAGLMFLGPMATLPWFIAFYKRLRKARKERKVRERWNP